MVATAPPGVNGPAGAQAAAAREAEAACLAYVLRNGEGTDKVIQALDEGDLSDVSHRLIFRALLGLWGERSPIDTVTVGTWLSHRGLISADGVDVRGDLTFSYLAHLIDNNFTGNLAHHLGLVAEAARRRRLADALSLSLGDSHRSSGSAADIASGAAERMDAAVRGSRATAALSILPCGELLRTYPERRPAVIEGLLRQGETMNIIAAPKIGKSWLTLGLALDVATGQPWLNTFGTARGNVLLIDNELHPETSAHRLRTLAGKRGIPAERIAEAVSIVNLRGRLKDLHGLGTGLRLIERGRFALIIIDAFYRTLPMGTDENDNATMSSLYNELDAINDALASAFVLIHHASKGNQSAKAVTDVGAGAGAQSRATDTHLILRPHEEDNAVVLDAAVRSWPPVKPICLRWDFPTWTPAADLDPADLRSERPRRRKPEGEEQPKEPPAPWTPRRFADTFGKPEPQPRAALLENARLCGLSERKRQELLRAAVDLGNLFRWPDDAMPDRWLVATVRPPDPPAPSAPADPSPAKAKRRRKK
jgi:hypothetical protein